MCLLSSPLWFVCCTCCSLNGVQRINLRYIDNFLRWGCGRALLEMGLFPNTKEITEYSTLSCCIVLHTYTIAAHHTMYAITPLCLAALFCHTAFSPLPAVLSPPLADPVNQYHHIILMHPLMHRPLNGTTSLLQYTHSAAFLLLSAAGHVAAVECCWSGPWRV